jgi:hypothetical protein
VTLGKIRAATLIAACALRLEVGLVTSNVRESWRVKTILRSKWRFNAVIPGGFALPLSLIQNSAPYAIRWAPKDIS